ncbi:MAG: OsmC family protein [Candidatus Delongbacteria bacterium]|nr:OsmC family protein [Candidatus Delongbacteria bacterium]MBN2835958.1 OsmC family protein [Candidatus Delongbacteria bacterium]
MDKSRELTAKIKLVNDKLHFSGSVDSNDPISIDYISPIGDDLGYTSLELLLLSLSSCVGSSILVILRKMHKSIAGLEINTTGLRNENHPTCFHTINLDLNLRSPNTSFEELNKVISLSEETYCPVWAMLKGNVEIKINSEIISS